MVPLELITLCHGTLLLLNLASESSERCLRHTPTCRGRCAVTSLSLPPIRGEIRGDLRVPTRVAMCPYVVTLPCGISWTAEYTAWKNDAAFLVCGFFLFVFCVVFLCLLVFSVLL